jgi:hypothetical protein
MFHVEHQLIQIARLEPVARTRAKLFHVEQSHLEHAHPDQRLS